MNVTIRELWTNRWLRACLVAAVIAAGAWPAWLFFHRDARLDYTLRNADGRDVPLAEFKGRPLLVNFWATWCPPCRTEIPWFVEFSEKYKAQRLAVVGISTDDPPEDIKKFAADNKVSYPLLVGVGHDDLLKSYEATEVIPVSWLIRADGSVFLRVTGIHPKEWFDTQLQALIDED